MNAHVDLRGMLNVGLQAKWEDGNRRVEGFGGYSLADVSDIAT